MRELIHNYEVWDTRTDEFDHTITVWKEGGDYYQVAHPARDSFDLDSLPATTPLPMELFIGRWDASLTELSSSTPPDHYLKRPCILLPENYVDQQEKHGFWSPGDAMTEEVGGGMGSVLLRVLTCVWNWIWS